MSRVPQHNVSFEYRRSLGYKMPKHQNVLFTFARTHYTCIGRRIFTVKKKNNEFIRSGHAHHFHNHEIRWPLHAIHATIKFIAILLFCFFRFFFFDCQLIDGIIVTHSRVKIPFWTSVIHSTLINPKQRDHLYDPHVIVRTIRNSIRKHRSCK